MFDISSAIEAILFASGDSVPIARLSLILGAYEGEIEHAAAVLAEKYENEGRGMRILKLEDKLQMCSAPEYAPFITKALEQRKPPMLSQSALEALAIVAYFQPVTRAYIDQVRGVDSSYTVGILLERGLMGISELSQLPPLPDMTNGEGIEKLQNAIDLLQNKDSQQISFSEVTGDAHEE